MLETHFQIFLYLDTYECSKHGKKIYKFLGCLFGRESHFIFAVRERFHLRKQTFINGKGRKYHVVFMRC